MASLSAEHFIIPIYRFGIIKMLRYVIASIEILNNPEWDEMKLRDP